MDKELIRNFIVEYQKNLEKKKFTKNFDDFIKPSKHQESGKIFKKKLKELLKTI